MEHLDNFAVILVIVGIFGINIANVMPYSEQSCKFYKCSVNTILAGTVLLIICYIMHL
jgi:hypothetical protein